MKKIITLFLLAFMTQWSIAQITIDPGEGRVGEQLPITIFGQNTAFTQFTQGSNSLNVFLQQGSSTIIYSYNSEAQSNTEIQGDLYLHPFSNPGIYDVVIGDANGFPLYVQENGFEILMPSLDETSVEMGQQGETLDLTLSGSNTLFSQGSFTVWFSQGSTTAFYPSDAVALDDENINVSLTIPDDAECGAYTTSVVYANGVVVNSENNFTVACIPEITGNVFVDEDQNSLYNEGESTWTGATISVNNGEFYINTDATGNFTLTDVEPGEYTFTVIPPDYYISSNFETIDITVTDAGEVFVTDTGMEINAVDFALSAEEAYDDVMVSLASSQAIAGYSNNYWITYENIGTTTVNGEISFTLDDRIAFEAASVPASQDGQTLTWSFEDLAPNDSRTISLFGLIDQGTTGELLTSNAAITLLADGDNLMDNTPLNNMADLKETVTSSFDPNDKLTDPTGPNFDNYVLMDAQMVYTVRFQNTGTAPAFNIRIEDPIDPNLDISTLQVIGSSHDYDYQLTDDYKVIFYFNDIDLVEQEVSETESQGFIKFTINAKEDIAVNTTVSNTASIFFDFNEPIVTNTVENIYSTTLPNGLLQVDRIHGKVTATPNPMVDRAELIMDEMDNSVHQLNIYSLGGQLIRSEKINPENRIYVERNDLNAGLYFYELIGDKYYTGKLLVN